MNPRILDVTERIARRSADTRQAYLQKIVREGLRQLGYGDQADRSIHFSYEMVALSPATAAVFSARREIILRLSSIGLLQVRAFACD